MADVVKATADVGVKNVNCLVLDGQKDCLDVIVTRASGSESIAVWLKACLPFWFQTQLYQRLMCSVGYYGNPHSTLPLLLSPLWE